MSTPPEKIATSPPAKRATDTGRLRVENVEPTTAPRGYDQEEWDTLTPAFQIALKKDVSLNTFANEDDVAEFIRGVIDDALERGESIYRDTGKGEEIPSAKEVAVSKTIPIEIMSKDADKEEEKFRKQMFDKLEVLNGLESYRPDEIADEELKVADYMLIPVSLINKVVVRREEDIGVKKLLSTVEILYVAALNAERLRASNHVDYVKIGLLRAIIANRGFQIATLPTELVDGVVLKGIHTYRGEIMVTTAVPDGWNSKKLSALTGISSEVAKEYNGTHGSDYSIMATLLPVFAAIQFQKTNHHYPKGDEAKLAYEKHFNSCVLDSIEPDFNKQDVIYTAVHWLGPYNGEKWKTNLNRIGKLPRGMQVKINPTPAGTALIRTQLAVWDAISVFPGAKGLMDYYDADLEKLRIADDAIMQDRLSCHVFAKLFNKISRLETNVIVEGAKAAARLAALAQGFIDAVAQKTDLARVKALRKHAENNIALLHIASAGFAGTLRRIRREANTVSLSEAIVPAARRADARPLPRADNVEIEEELPIVRRNA